MMGAQAGARADATIRGSALRADQREEGSLLPDTHAHLGDPAFDSDRDVVVRRAREAGIDRILTVGSDLASSRRAVELSRAYPSVYAAVGVHPHHASQFEREAEDVRRLLQAEKVVAVGEVGLDYYRDGVAAETQREAFRTQLRWAQEAGLPVSVHNRDADADVLALLDEIGVRAVLHCFSGTQTIAERALAAGHILSFAGNITFPRAEMVRQVAATVPADRLLTESDAPVLAPQPWRGRRNEPAHVTATCETLATVRGVPAPCLAPRISRTADEVFGWRAP